MGLNKTSRPSTEPSTVFKFENVGDVLGAYYEKSSKVKTKKYGLKLVHNFITKDGERLVVWGQPGLLTMLRRTQKEAKTNIQGFYMEVTRIADKDVGKGNPMNDYDIAWTSEDTIVVHADNPLLTGDTSPSNSYTDDESEPDYEEESEPVTAPVRKAPLAATPSRAKIDATRAALGLSKRTG